MTEENNTKDAPQNNTAPVENTDQTDSKDTAPVENNDTTGSKDVEVPEKFKTIVKEIESMSVIDLNELVKIFEEKFGVSATMVASAGSADDAGEDSGGGLVSVELADAGAQKIQVIKAVKEVLGLGLKEAKDLVDGAPAMLKEGIEKEESDELKKKIEDSRR